MHSKGRLAIVRLRGPQQLQNKIGRNLFILFYHQQLVWSYDDCGAILQEYPTWADEWYPNTPIARLEILMHEVSCFVSDVKQSTATSNLLVVENLLERGRVLEDRLSTAAETFLVSWPEHKDILGRLTGSDRHIDLPEQLRSNFDDLPSNLDIYANITRALTANLLRAIHIRLLQALNLALQHPIMQGTSQSNLEELAIQLRHVMLKRAEEIQRDVPLAIGDCRGYQRGNHQTSNQCGEGTLGHERAVKMDGHQCHHSYGRYRIHGRALRAWITLFPLESALTVELMPESLRKRLTRSLNCTQEMMGLNTGA